jgi:hypothetical protein
MEARVWRKRRYDVPAPQRVKWAVLDRHMTRGATWVETGTYLGDTTEFLAKRAPMVFSIEPADTLYEAGKHRFRNRANVKLIHGTSETAFPGLLKELSGNVCFWLDGHASGGITFQGASSTPVMNELQEIEASLANFSSVVVLVDDVRCFDPGNPVYADYPPRSKLVEWAERNGMNWHIEHDIFVAERASGDSCR